VPAALITEAAANPAEADYLAAELARNGIEVRCVQDTGIPADPGLVILIPFVNTPVTAAVMDWLPGLRLIATKSTGTDHIDLDQAARRGITVRNVADYGSVAVAEHTFALLLTLTRMRPHPAPGTDLSGKTIGVIGTGAIGRHVMQIAHGFGMNVLAYDLEQRPGIRYAPLDQLLASSDVITLHIPAVPGTHHPAHLRHHPAQHPRHVAKHPGRLTPHRQPGCQRPPPARTGQQADGTPADHDHRAVRMMHAPGADRAGHQAGEAAVPRQPATNSSAVRKASISMLAGTVHRRTCPVRP
jgi:D-isomer specific 2-hydroxyacid dehydrogenase-like protein